MTTAWAWLKRRAPWLTALSGNGLRPTQKVSSSLPPDITTLLLLEKEEEEAEEEEEELELEL